MHRQVEGGVEGLGGTVGEDGVRGGGVGACLVGAAVDGLWI